MYLRFEFDSNIGIANIFRFSRAQLFCNTVVQFDDFRAWLISLQKGVQLI